MASVRVACTRIAALRGTPNPLGKGAFGGGAAKVEWARRARRPAHLKSGLVICMTLSPTTAYFSQCPSFAFSPTMIG